VSLIDRVRRKVAPPSLFSGSWQRFN